MAIKARLRIDDEECNARFKYNDLNSRDACYRQIEKARAAGYEIDPEVEEYFY